MSNSLPKRHLPIIQGFVRRLEAPPPCNTILNAYIIHILNDMQAREARQAIEDAFEQNKVALDIIDSEDVDVLGDA